MQGGKNCRKDKGINVEKKDNNRFKKWRKIKEEEERKKKEKENSIKLQKFNVEVEAYWFSSGAQSCLALCDPMNCSTPGLPVHHQLLESTQTHVY